MTRVETTLEYANKGKTAALRIPEEARCLFPGYGDRNKNTFKIRSDFGEDAVWVALPHPSGLPHIPIKRTGWFKALSPKPKDGDKVFIEVRESKSGREYYLVWRSSPIA